MELMRFVSRAVFALSLATLGATSVHAKATPEELARLGKQATCTGAEKAGTASGVAEYTGKWLGPGPGMVTEVGKHPVDPYAAEKPLLTITAQNMANYADKLSEGQKGLFKKYPATFRMQIYPSHRDFRFDDTLCKAIAMNAAETELIDDGINVKNGHKGATLFPFPKSGLELLWNGAFPTRSNVEYRETDLAVVYQNGNILWGRQLMWQYARMNDPKLRGTKMEGIAAYTKLVTLLPEREKGAMTKTLDFFTMNKDQQRLAWQYIPAVRRVRQAPGFGFDMPNPSSANTITIDETRLFNGSGQRYQWKIIGKKELYIPYNGFKLEGREAGQSHYAKLLTPGHENPDFVRWELHRVWILEAKLKEEFRHIYATRVFYLDEDNMQFTMSDTFDNRGQLWRFNWINNLYVPGPNIFGQFTAFYHDFSNGQYTAYDLTQDKPQWVVTDQPGVDYANPDFYSLDNLKAGGY